MVIVQLMNKNLRLTLLLMLLASVLPLIGQKILHLHGSKSLAVNGQRTLAISTDLSRVITPQPVTPIAGWAQDIGIF